MGSFVGESEYVGRSEDRFVGQYLIQHIAQVAGGSSIQEWFESDRWPVIVSVAVGEDQAPHPLRVKCRKDLDNTAAAVVADQVYLFDLQGIEHLFQHVGVRCAGDVLIRLDFRFSMCQ